MIELLIKKRREALGYSQQKLAELSGLSIATIQNLEAGKGNPTFDVLEQISKVLNFKINFTSNTTNWDRLCDYGLSLVQEETKSKSKRTIKELKELLISAAFEIRDSSALLDKERYSDAFSALLFGIKLHYPSFFKKNLQVPILIENLPLKLSGRQLKLYRYSKSILGEYL
jgi:transcriptional regulator with XRE-family HTH domain